MKKTTLFLMSLFLTVGAMAQDYRFEEIDIKSNADAMLYSNAPCKVTTWGDDFRGWHVLFDNKPGTFFHSDYSGDPSVDGLDHYLRVDMGAGNELTTFKFTFTTRNQNSEVNSPTTIVVEGSNEADGPYTEIKTITGISTDNSYKYESEVLGNANAYRYIRFRVTATRTNQTQGGKVFFFISEFGMSRAIRNGYVHNTGSMSRNQGEERGLTTFTLTDGENSLEVSDIQDANSRTAPVYVDKSAQKLTTKQGATLKFTVFNYTGSWMHAYAYIDYNNDFEFNLTNNNNGEGEGEIVSYNYYNGNDITGTPASQGSAIGNTYGESKAMPAFTLPRNLPAGEYRVRIKIDWNNLDADYGASDIATNGGCQCDFTIVVEEAVGNEIAWDALNNAVDEALALFNDVKIGTSVGSYSSSINGYEAEFNDIVSYKNSITEDTPADEIDVKTARVREIIASFSLNMPKAGDYIRIKSIEGWNDDARYLGAQNSTVETSRAEFVAGAGANTIFYFDGENLISYASGNYLVNNSSFLGYKGVQTDGTVVEFRTSNNTSNRHAYNISFKGNDNATRWLYTNTGNYTDAGSDCGTEGGYNFNLEPVTELPVAVTAAGYATFYAPVAVELPGGVKAYTVAINGEWATLTEIEGSVIPAKTGVVLEAAENSYNLAITTTGATATSALVGTVATEYIAEEACVLSKPNGKEIGFYLAEKNIGATGNKLTGEAEIEAHGMYFQNNSHKAYLKVPAGAALSAGFRFSFGGTTAVEDVEIENEREEIYDLTGRKLSEITKPGIYIVGGKKVLVK